MMELVKLRQQQQTTKACLQMMEQRLRKNEARQQQMMTFLARAVKNPDFLQQLVHQKDIMRELENAATKKRRRRPIDQAPIHNINVEVGDGFVKIEPDQEEFGRVNDRDISELDSLALDIQGLSGFSVHNYEEEGGNEGFDGRKNDDDEGYLWEHLLDDEIEKEMGLDMGGGHEDGDDGNVDVLVQQLGFLDSDIM
ncbi:hypothetical protein LINGRAHAP2_LOCUS6674 [Linum grandiflorum]